MRDELEEWRVRGRIATAIRTLKETLARLTTDAKEFDDAMAEAESLGLGQQETAAIGSGVVQ